MGILVFVEIQSGKVSNTTKAAFSLAESLSKPGLEITALIAGMRVEKFAVEAIALGANRVLLIEDKELEKYRSLPYAKVLANVIADERPKVVICGYSTSSTDFVPRVSIQTKSSVLVGATSLNWDGESLVAIKPIHKEKLNMKFRMTGSSILIIPAMGAFASSKPDPARKGGIIKKTMTFSPSDLIEEVLSVDLVERTVDLSESKFIISGGRGVGSKEGFKVIYDTAKALGAQVASSRAVHDAGWTDEDLHVGQTGQQVAPDIYIAAGISGAIQHVAGMKKSKTVIVVNQDPEAPIWSVAKYGIVGDLHKVLPLIVKKIQET